jgi:CHASE3 domain sensor protein
MKNIASPKVSIGFIATLIVLVANAVVAYQSISTISDNNRAATYRDRVLTTLDKIQSRLKDIERGQQEYLRTSNPDVWQFIASIWCKFKLIWIYSLI